MLLRSASLSSSGVRSALALVAGAQLRYGRRRPPTPLSGRAAGSANGATTLPLAGMSSGAKDGRQLHVAVVGGGLTGAAAAWRLATQHGSAVTVFDLGRRAPGGRASTRKTPVAGGSGQRGGGDDMPLQWDHGAQFLMRGEAQATLQPMLGGVLERWRPRLASVDVAQGAFSILHCDQPCAVHDEPGFFGCLSASDGLFVGKPSMDALPAALLGASHRITVQLGTKVTAAEFDNGWRLSGTTLPKPGSSSAADISELGKYDALVLTDVGNLLRGRAGHVAITGQAAVRALAAVSAAASQAERMPLFALMMSFESPGSGLPFDAASIQGGRVRWLAKDSSKPGRERADGRECWVAITTEAFGKELLGSRDATGALPAQTEEYLSSRTDTMFEILQRDLSTIGLTLPAPAFMRAHRWGSAYVGGQPPGDPAACIHSAAARLAVAGDFVAGGGAGGALKSGIAAADALVDSCQQ